MPAGSPRQQDGVRSATPRTFWDDSWPLVMITVLLVVGMLLYRLLSAGGNGAAADH
jgi:hypothetical protein